MTDLISLSIAFSSETKKLELDYISGLRIDMSEVEMLLGKLSHVDLRALKDDDHKKAFWINIYNGLANYIVISRKVKRTMICSLHLFSMHKIQVGDYQWSLNQIEHGLLRHNSVPPFHLRKVLGRSDARLKHMVERKDGRIHFALNCGGLSCPSIRFYSPESINYELDNAKDAFLDNNLFIDDENRTIRCSLLFKWYRKDFEGAYIFQPKYKDYTINYMSYNWSLDDRNLMLEQL